MLTGRCLCGAVRYELDGELGPPVCCHCSQCRKASGAAFATNASVAKSALRIVSGEDAIAEYESSPGQFRCFCRRCGSPLLKRRDDKPDELRLRLGSLDGDPGVRPVAHIWVGDKAPWLEIHDDLPQFEKEPRPAP